MNSLVSINLYGALCVPAFLRFKRFLETMMYMRFSSSVRVEVRIIRAWVVLIYTAQAFIIRILLMRGAQKIVVSFCVLRLSLPEYYMEDRKLIFVLMY